MQIKELKARGIKNSRKEAAIEVIINKKYSASAPSGASTGTHEVRSFPKKGIRYAIEKVNKYNFKELKFEKFKDLEILDAYIKSWGGNTVVALQSAILKAMAKGNVWKFLNPKAKVLPTPLGNCIGGGAHTKLESIDIQEFLLIPKAKTFKEKVKINRKVYDMIGKQLKLKKKTDEGAFISNESTITTLKFMTEYMEQIKKTKGWDVSLGVDIAASQFYKKGKYNYRNFWENEKRIVSRKEQINIVNNWINDYNLKYVEDPLEEEDFRGFAKLNQKTLICGDDLITTNIDRFKKAITKKAVNAIIIKPNQIGSLVKTKELVDFARKNRIKTIISHRSGETMDPIISHLAVAWKIPYIKTGIYGKEREIKLQELIKIERQIKA